MKTKKYTKPVVIFEDFILSQSIAACAPSLKANISDITCLPDDVEVIIKGTNLFVEKLSCEKTPATDDDLYNLFCYHTVSDDLKIFAS